MEGLFLSSGTLNPMNIVCFDSTDTYSRLLPLTYTRPVADIRVGICSIADKWRASTGLPVSFLTQEHLRIKYPSELSGDDVFIDGSVIPDAGLVREISNLPKGKVLTDASGVVACRSDDPDPKSWRGLPTGDVPSVRRIDRLWKIFQFNGEEIKADFARLTQGRTSAPLEDPHTRVYAGERIFLEAGATVRAATINASTGPVYLAAGSEVQEGAIIRGPFALGEASVLAMGAMVRGDTSIGPYSKAGGELNNVLMLGWSNKGHEGYLGNAVIGEYCNLGAGTFASNLRNDFSAARLWSYALQRFEDTGTPFCGPVMGDGCRTAIGTLLNTATSIGPGANLIGNGFPRAFIPGFVSGGAQAFKTRTADEVIRSISAQLALKGLVLPEVDKNIWREVFRLTAEFRTWPA